MRRRDFLAATGLVGLAGTAGLLTTGPAAGSEGEAIAATADGDGQLSGVLGRIAPETTRGIPGILMHFLVRPEETAGRFALIHARGRKGMEPAPHVHEHEDEIVRLYEGRIRFDIGGESIEAGPGDVVFMPRRVPHGFELLTDTIEADLILTPGDFAEYFWRYSEPVAGDEVPAPPTGPPPPERLQAMLAELAERGVRPAV